MKRTAATTKNNVFGVFPAVAIETLDSTWTRFDFGIHWWGADGALSFTIGAEVYLWTGFAFVPDVGINGLPLIGVKWSAGTNPGTIKETYTKGGTNPDGDGIVVGATTITTRDNIYPGFGAFQIQDTDPPDAGLPGPRYTFLLSGTEYRIYVNAPGLSQRPIAVAPSPSTGYPFPVYLFCKPNNNFVAVRNIQAGGNLFPTTIYSKRDQIADFGAAQTNLNLRIYQIGRFGIHGLPVDAATSIAAPSAPLAPTLLTATAIAFNRVDLAWVNNATNEDGFKIERRTDLVFTVDNTTDLFTSVGNTFINGDTVTVSNSGGGLPAPLAGATVYFVRDKSGDTFKLAATLGGAAINITTNGTGTNVIGIFALIYTAGPSTTSYSDTTTVGLTTYSYRVRAYNAGGNSAYTNEASATTFFGSVAASLLKADGGHLLQSGGGRILVV
jgi:hypothetical protein